jgi:hypothetical protein
VITSPIVSVGKLEEIGQKIESFLSEQTSYMSPHTVSSPRAVGDALQSILESEFGGILGSDVAEYSSHFARRAMADVAFTDSEGFYHVVDIKTHRLDTAFNMPNLTSVERLSRFYEDDRNYFDLLLIAYRVEDSDVRIENVQFTPIEHLEWSCLTIGALGWGQIQIANSNRVESNHSQTRRDWMIELCDTLLAFYPSEIAKIGLRIERFENIREYWVSRS